MVRSLRPLWGGTLLAIAAPLAVAPAALASTPHIVLAPAFLGFLGGVFHSITSVLLGGLNWTVDVAGKFILATLGGLIRLLIPASWARDGLEVMQWIVAVPDYAGTVTSPTGHTVYGFAGINALRDLFAWIGAALLPLSLVYATSRAALGAGGGHVVAPIGRVLGLAAVLVSYPWWWSQAAAAADQLTHFVLALPPVSHGIYKLMQYAVGGVALGGWQLIDLFLMGAIGVALLGLIFLKVVIILLGALLYAVGPVMIGLVPSEGGLRIARAWASAAGMLLALPLAWSTILAVGALLINDSTTAGPLIAGSGTIAHVLGGLLLALAGLASLWLCVRIAREAGIVLRGQLSGMVALGGARVTSTGSAAPVPARRAADSLRGFSARVAGATGAALGAAGPAGQAIASGTAGAVRHSRHGLLGAGGTLARTGVVAASPKTAALVGRTRAGAVAVRMGRAGAASWQESARTGAARSARRVTSFPAVAGSSRSAADTRRTSTAQKVGAEVRGGTPGTPSQAASTGGPASTAGRPAPPAGVPQPKPSSTRAQSERDRDGGTAAPPASKPSPNASSPPPPERPRPARTPRRSDKPGGGSGRGGG